MKTKQVKYKTLRAAMREANNTSIAEGAAPYAVYTVGKSFGVGRMIYNSKRIMHVPGVTKSRIVWDTIG